MSGDKTWSARVALLASVVAASLLGFAPDQSLVGEADAQATPCRDESLPYDEAKSNNDGVETPYLGILGVRLVDEETVEFDWCINLPADHGTLYEPNFSTATFAMGGYHSNGGWIGSAPTIVQLVEVNLGETVYGTTVLTNSGEENYLDLSVITEGEFIELAIRARYDHVVDDMGARVDGHPIEAISPPAVVVVIYDFAGDEVVDPPPPDPGDPGDPGDPPPPDPGDPGDPGDPPPPDPGDPGDPPPPDPGDPGDPGGDPAPTPTCYFPDVDVANTHAANILAICIRQITQGFSDGTYRPADFVTRAQMASFIARALGLAPVTSNRFTDVSGIHAGNINAIADAGVTLGCNSGGTEFCPDDFVTRAQMASFLARAFGMISGGGNTFADVVAGSTHAANIEALRLAEVTLGCDTSGTIYCPDDFVKRDQMASFMERSMEFAESGA